MREEGVVANAERQGAYLRARLEDLAASFSFVRQVRGMGLLLGMELGHPGQPIVDACQKRGLLLNCAAGCVLRFLPPLVVTEGDIDQAVDILVSVFREVEKGESAPGSAPCGALDNEGAEG
jgi:acetylornithine/succinyldiaminopimelate/putrescine aminotransferase